MHDGSFDVVSCKEVFFGGLQNLNSTFSPIFSQKYKKNYNGAYGEN